MPKIIEVMMMCEELSALVERESRSGADLFKQVISISTNEYKIMYVPKGSEQVAKMELNER